MAEKKTPDISRYTFDTAESIFKDFEPYHCGIPAITEGFADFELDPEKCDETNNFQSFKANGYTEEILTDKLINIIPNEYTEEILTNKTIKKIHTSYKINGRLIKGCKKGTVILGNHPNHETELARGELTDDIIIKVTGNNNNKVLKIGNDSFNINYFNEKHLIFPKRLGILLVGGGGGAGGGTWYDAEKNGKPDDRFYCSGGSGGGGGILWGVINLIDNRTNSYLEYSIKSTKVELAYRSSEWETYIKEANGGLNGFYFNYSNYNKSIAGETSTIISTLYSIYYYCDGGFCTWKLFSNYFKNSEDDFNRIIRKLGFNTPNKDMAGRGGVNAVADGVTHNSPHKGTDGYPGSNTLLYFGNKVIATAFGGEGGKAGHWEKTAGGGAGGKGDCDSDYFKAGVVLAGLSGISTQKDMEDVSMPERTYYVEFLPDTTNDHCYSFKIGTIASQQAILAGDTSARIPGGHSFGTGAYQNSSGDGSAAGIGGGGCSNGTEGYNHGSKGYWVIFYA